jgi:hypothetical protein
MTNMFETRSNLTFKIKITVEGLYWNTYEKIDTNDTNNG